MDRVLRRWAPLLAVGGLLAAAWLAASLSSPQVTSLSVPSLNGAVGEQPPVPAAGTPPSGKPAADVRVPDWLTALGTLLCTAVAVLVVGALTWYLLRDRVRSRSRRETVAPTAPAATRTDVVAAVDAGLSELSHADADPRRAIIACWVRLEQAAGAAGTPRRPSDSSTDLVARLLDAHQVSANVLDGLAVVYREARYTTHPLDERTRASAVAALRHLRAELDLTAVPVQGRPPEQPALVPVRRARP